MKRLALLCTLALSACANISPRASSDLPQGNAPIPTPAIEKPGAAHVVPGTLVVEDELGVRTPVRAGTIQFWLTARGGDLLEAAVHEGEFVLELPYKGELDVGPITIDGGSFWAVGSWEFGAMPERADLVARPVKPAFVQCIDAETGAPLSKGRVRRAGPNEWIADSFEDARPLASPFEVPLFAGRDDDVVRGWIGLRGYEISPTGYARRRVAIDPSEGGTRTFEFEKAATLRVRLWVEREDSRTHGLTVSDLNSNEYWQSPSFDGPPVRDPGEPNRWFHTLTIDDQPPGDYLVMPDAFVSGDGDPYGAVRVRVQAGDVVDVDLRPAEVPALPRKFELQGTLRLIEGIDPARITLRFRPSNSQSGPSESIRAPLDLRGDQFVMDRRDPEIAYWFAGSVPPGRWIASVPEVGWSQEFAHDSDAAVALELTQTPPSARQSVRFRVVEGRTGRALDHADIGVHVDGDPNPPGCDGASSTWTASIHSGNARVFIRSHDLSAPDFEFEFAPENDTTTLTVWRDLQVEVRAYDGVARIGAPEIRELSPTIEPIGDAVVARYPSMTVSRVNWYTRNVTQPGRYRVTLPPNDRYAPHPPIEVVVKPNEPTPVAVFRLTRRAR